MKINLITKTYNCAWIIPYFFSHYDQFVTNYYVFDNISSDNTIELLKLNPKVTIFSLFDTEFDDYKHREFKNEAWKKFKDCDWIINCDIDEFLYHPHITDIFYSEFQFETQVLKSLGYQMFSEIQPLLKGQIYDEIKTGVRDSNYDKPIIFKPDSEPCFSFGAHHLENNNLIVWQSDIRLLHYKFIGKQSIDELLKRNERLSERNKREGLSLWPDKEGHRFNPYDYYEYLKQNAIEIV